MAGYPPNPFSNEYGAPTSQSNVADPCDASSQLYGLFNGAPSAGSFDYAPAAPYGDPFASVLPSGFTPGTDPNVVAAFQLADRYGSGFIDADGFKRALTSLGHNLSDRSVRLAMDVFHSSKMGPKKFVSAVRHLNWWKRVFLSFDRYQSGLMEPTDLEDALMNIGFSVPPMVSDLLVLKLKKIGGKAQPIDYDNFIECCLIVKGLSEKFNAKDIMRCNAATFTYQDFMLTVAPFIE